eukprot:225382-Chlamydomonas_euryale.AAC.2
MRWPRKTGKGGMRTAQHGPDHQAAVFCAQRLREESSAHGAKGDSAWDAEVNVRWFEHARGGASPRSMCCPQSLAPGSPLSCSAPRAPHRAL